MPTRLVIGADELQAGVTRLAAEIAADHPEGVVLVAVLKGSVMFLADLVRQMDVPVEVDFLAVSSYGEDTGRIRLVMDLSNDISGRPVVLVEDIIDTGLTLTWLLGVLRARGPSSLRVCTLLDKAVRRIVPTPIDYVGFELADDFLLGYGLDFGEVYRNVDRVLAGDLEALAGARDAYVEELFPG